MLSKVPCAPVTRSSAWSASFSSWFSPAFQLFEFLGDRFVLDCLQHKTLASLTIGLLDCFSAKFAGDLSMIGRPKLGHE